jgi:hypothetical protein
MLFVSCGLIEDLSNAVAQTIVVSTEVLIDKAVEEGI